MKRGPQAVATVKVAAVSQDDAFAAFLPAFVLASPVEAKVLALYRMLLAEGLGCTQVGQSCKEVAAH